MLLYFLSILLLYFTDFSEYIVKEMCNILNERNTLKTYDKSRIQCSKLKALDSLYNIGCKNWGAL